MRNRQLKFVRPTQKTKWKTIPQSMNHNHIFAPHKISQSIMLFLQTETPKILSFYFNFKLCYDQILIIPNQDRIDMQYQKDVNLTIKCSKDSFTIYDSKKFNIDTVEYNNPNMFSIINQALRQFYLSIL